MDFIYAVSAAFKNYFDFRGRASRSEFWYFALFQLIVYFAGIHVDNLLFGSTSDRFILAAISLVFFIPAISVLVRRLHDIGRSGWYALLGIVPPVFGVFWLIYWACRPSEPVSNAYGDRPV